MYMDPIPEPKWRPVADIDGKVCIYVYIYIYTYISLYKYIHVHIYRCIIYVYMYMQIYVYIYHIWRPVAAIDGKVCIYEYIYAYIHI
jgi:hypothetical protein